MSRRRYRRRSPLGEVAGTARRGPWWAPLAVGGFAFVLLAMVYPLIIDEALTSDAFGFLQPLMERLMGRYDHVATLLGIACLVLGIGLSAWRYLSRSRVNAARARQASWLARVIARIID